MPIILLVPIFSHYSDSDPCNLTTPSNSPPTSSFLSSPSTMLVSSFDHQYPPIHQLAITNLSIIVSTSQSTATLSTCHVPSKHHHWLQNESQTLLDLSLGSSLVVIIY